MGTKVCCVCDQPVPEDDATVGGRNFCTLHRERVGRDRAALWVSTGAAVLGLVLFALGVHLIVRATQPNLQGAALIAAGAVCALVPALLWLVVFYLQDRLEPEPKRYVLGVFAAGAALALVIALPLVQNVFQVQTWLPRTSWPVQLLGAVLIVGFAQEFCKYAAVRYTVYRTPEYDERVDGILYGAAAGLGFATVLNMQYVIGSGGVRLDIGVLRITVTALAHASFGGVMGYFMGRAKFERMGKGWLPAGLATTALLNGIVTSALGWVSRRGLDLMPLNRLAVAACVAVATFGVLLALIRRSNAADRAADGRHAA